MMQRGVRQHEAQGVLARSNTGCQRLARCIQHQDGGGPVLQQIRLRLARHRVASHHFDIPRHQGKSLVIALLALAQGIDGLRVARIAGQVDTADSLDGDYVALA